MQEKTKPEAAPSSINFRLPPDLRATLAERARQDDRTMNNFVIHMLRQHLQRPAA